VYAVGALVVKRAAESGVGAWRTAFVANVIGALLFQPLLLFGGTIHAELWWQPVVVGFSFMVGQWFTFTSMEHGDVSLATPVLGLKILFVAALVTAFGGATLRPQLWSAAVLATLGIVLLNRPGGRARSEHAGRTIRHAALAALAFAAFDVLVQRWSPAWGIGRFLPLTMIAAAMFSLAFVPRFRAPLRELSPATWRWLLAGTATMAAQSVMFVSTVAHWGNAPAANVIYSSRGLWSVVLVWLFGHWIGSREQLLGRRVLAWRLAGAVCMMGAIALVLVQ
jgi:drug/metabolite transporter (DMT)-like permease